MDASLLDTDILSELLKQRNATVKQKASAYLQAHGQFAFSVFRDRARLQKEARNPALGPTGHVLPALARPAAHGRNLRPCGRPLGTRLLRAPTSAGNTATALSHEINSSGLTRQCGVHRHPEGSRVALECEQRGIGGLVVFQPREDGASQSAARFDIRQRKPEALSFGELYQGSCRVGIQASISPYNHFDSTSNSMCDVIRTSSASKILAARPTVMP